MAGNVNCTQNTQFTPLDPAVGAEVGQLAPGPSPTTYRRSRTRARVRPWRSADAFPAVPAVASRSHHRSPRHSSNPSSNGATAAPDVRSTPCRSPVQNLQAVPGNGNVILHLGAARQRQWHVRAAYQYRSPSTVARRSPSPVNSPQVLCPNGISTDCYRFNVNAAARMTPATRSPCRPRTTSATATPARLPATPSTNTASRIVVQLDDHGVLDLHDRHLDAARHVSSTRSRTESAACSALPAARSCRCRATSAGEPRAPRTPAPRSPDRWTATTTPRTHWSR